MIESVNNFYVPTNQLLMSTFADGVANSDPSTILITDTQFKAKICSMFFNRNSNCDLSLTFNGSTVFYFGTVTANVSFINFFPNYILVPTDTTVQLVKSTGIALRFAMQYFLVQESG